MRRNANRQPYEPTYGDDYQEEPQPIGRGSVARSKRATGRGASSSIAQTAGYGQQQPQQASPSSQADDLERKIRNQIRLYRGQGESIQRRLSELASMDVEDAPLRAQRLYGMLTAESTGARPAGVAASLQRSAFGDDY